MLGFLLGALFGGLVGTLVMALLRLADDADTFDRQTARLIRQRATRTPDPARN